MISGYGTSDKGLGVNTSESQAVHDLGTTTLQNAVTGQSDTSSAQSLVLTLEYQAAKSHSTQSAAIEQNGQIIKQQLDTIAMLEDQKQRAEAAVFCDPAPLLRSCLLPRVEARRTSCLAAPAIEMPAWISSETR